MKFTRRLALLAASLLIVLCADGQDVHISYARSANFADYKSYQWVDIQGVPDELIDQATKRVIDERLAQKGITRVEKDPDLYVGYHALMNLENPAEPWSTGAGVARSVWASHTARGETPRISMSDLVLDLYDPGKKQLIWRGESSNTIALTENPYENCKNLQKAIAKLFKNFPPQPNK